MKPRLSNLNDYGSRGSPGGRSWGASLLRRPNLTPRSFARRPLSGNRHCA
jgi:hypothetical protein